MLSWIFASETAHSIVEHATEHSAHQTATTHHAQGPLVPEVGNIITYLSDRFHDYPFVQFLHNWENPIFSIFIALVIIWFFRKAASKRALIPGRLQSVAEIAIESLDNLVCGVIGPHGRQYTPFIATVFIYIWVQNLMGLVPFLKSPTSSINTTASIAIVVFLYVQFIGIKENGPWGYIHHLMGSPKDIVGWCLAPLMFFLHVVGEFIKPVSLSLRLFGNIMGEDALIGVFASIGILILSFMHSPVGIPLQLPFMLLALLTGTIQALVFSLLSTIYIFLMLPHHEHEEAHQH